jgi:hypothetical protein
MKTYQVKYTKGHLVDMQTQNRIFLKRGGMFTILGDDDQFEENDELNIELEPLLSDEKKNYLEKRYPNHEIIKVLNSKQRLFYRIGLSKQTSEEKENEYIFAATLLEDLYLKKSINGVWTMCECLCETKECLYGDIQLVETVRGLSLNNLFSNMVAFYFPLQRSGACNAFKDFYIGNEKTKLYSADHIKILPQVSVLKPKIVINQ